MHLHTLIDSLERLAPRSFQEGYDNSGLLVGNPAAEVRGVLVCLDATEAVIVEALERGCNVVVAHHPIVFKGLKTFTGRTYVERVVMDAIRYDVALYAIHTNLDNVRAGVNAKIAERIGLHHTTILQPKKGIIKQLSTYVPIAHLSTVRAALFAAGGGTTSGSHYTETSFNTVGAGTFKGDATSNGFSGEREVRHTEAEIKLEMLYDTHRERALLAALHAAHPYEEVAYNLVALENTHPNVGAGMVGTLAQPMPEAGFLSHLKTVLPTACIRHTALRGKPVERVAICGGAGSELLPQAIAAGADAFVTADFKYHQFFDAEGRTVIADIGHYETEQFTIELLYEHIAALRTRLAQHDEANFTPFSVFPTEINTNPVYYY